MSSNPHFRNSDAAVVAASVPPPAAAAVAAVSPRAPPPTKKAKAKAASAAAAAAAAAATASAASPSPQTPAPAPVAASATPPASAPKSAPPPSSARGAAASKKATLPPLASASIAATVAAATTTTAETAVTPAVASVAAAPALAPAPAPAELDGLRALASQLRDAQTQIRNESTFKDGAGASTAVPVSAPAPDGAFDEEPDAVAFVHLQRTLLMKCDDDIETLKERYVRLGATAQPTSPAPVNHTAGGGGGRSALLPVPGSMELSTFLRRFQRSLQPAGRRAIAALLVAAVRELHEERIDGAQSEFAAEWSAAGVASPPPASSSSFSSSSSSSLSSSSLESAAASAMAPLSANNSLASMSLASPRGAAQQSPALNVNPLLTSPSAAQARSLGGGIGQFSSPSPHTPSASSVSYDSLTSPVLSTTSIAGTPFASPAPVSSSSSSSSSSLSSSSSVTAHTVAHACSTGPVHCAIQPNRFVLLKPMSDEWRLMVDLALLSPKDAPVKHDAVDPRLHAQRYQAPELVVADAPLRAGYAQDIFSLGLVLFEVLTGSPLFCSDAEAAAVYRDLSTPALRRKAGAVFIEHCVRRRLNELGVADRTLRDFLYRALQFAPHLRPTAARMAQHPLLPRV